MSASDRGAAIDRMVQVLWNARSKLSKDLRQAQEIPITDHYGRSAKERILSISRFKVAIKSRADPVSGGAAGGGG